MESPKFLQTACTPNVQAPGTRAPIPNVRSHEGLVAKRTTANLPYPFQSHPLRVSCSNRATRSGPLVSVILLTYNGVIWLERCLASLQRQTIFDRLEVIIADNGSSDESVPLAAKLAKGWGVIIRNESNLGYSEGNNRAALKATGKYLFFLNPDTWLEPQCLERLVEQAERVGATAAGPLVLEYANDSIQREGGNGFDVFGFMSGPAAEDRPREVLAVTGCSLLIEADTFRRLGGFDPQFFMYADEYDLCWRVWLAGGKVVLTPSARLHHRSAAAVNPRGCQEVLEARTSDTKRYYANRNNLLVLLKNCEHLLLLLVVLQVALLTAETLAMWALTRRWSHVRRAYLDALGDCWQMRGYVRAERSRLSSLRRRGDFWMIRFLRARLNRWGELQRFRRLGLPKVDRG